MKSDDQQTQWNLSAYLDGELSADETQRTAAAIASDTALQAKFERLKKLHAGLLQETAQIDQVPPAAKLSQLLETPNSASVHPIKSASTPARRKQPWLVGGSMAAALVLFTLVAQITMQAPSVPSALASMDVSAHDLQAPLSQSISGDQVELPQGLLQQTLAFERQDGALCKLFTLRSTAAVEAVACYTDGSWQVPVAQPTAASVKSGFQPASGSASPVQAYIGQTIKGTALTPTEERALAPINQ